MTLSSRTLDEQLPIVCDGCGFSFSRALDEYFKLGAIRCPKCLASVELDEGDIAELARAIDLLHGIEDDLKD